MKSFTTEKTDDEERPLVEFEFDGHMLTARKPKTAAFVALVRVNDDDGAESANGVMRFVRDSLTPESRAYLMKRLDDPDDDLDVENLVPLVNWVVEEFTGEEGNERPTGPSNGSSPQRRRTGSTSTARSRSAASTPSTSPSNDSATP